MRISTGNNIKFMINIATWLAIITLCLVYGVLIGANFTFRFIISDTYDDYWLIILELAVFGFSLLFIGSSLLTRRVCRQKNIDSRLFFRESFLAISALFLIWILRDEAPVTSRYSWEDLPVPEKNAAKSYELAYGMLGWGEQRLYTDLSNIDIWAAMKDPLKHENEILQKWQDIEQARSIINELDAFTHVADLSTVDTVMDYNLITIIYITRIYGAYAALMVEKGQAEKGAYQLVQLHSVARKALPYARFAINKCIWAAAAKQCIENAMLIATHPDISPNALKILQQGFSPLTNREVSFRVALTSEFFFMIAESDFDNFDDLFEQLCDSFGLGDSYSAKWNRLFLRTVLPIILQRNKAVNDGVVLFDYLIEGADHQPPNFDKLEAYIAQFDHKLGIRNIGGWIFLNSSIAEMRSYPNLYAKTKVQSDLLAIYLNERLGIKHDIKDYFTGAEYMATDSPHIYKSAGPDGVDETNDDIVFGPAR